MSVPASLVKELRERTGAGMMDCKRALAETRGDLEKAADYLREKGLAAAAKSRQNSRKDSWKLTYTAPAKLGFWWK